MPPQYLIRGGIALIFYPKKAMFFFNSNENSYLTLWELLQFQKSIIYNNKHHEQIQLYCGFTYIWFS